MASRLLTLVSLLLLVAAGWPGAPLAAAQTPPVPTAPAQTPPAQPTPAPKPRAPRPAQRRATPTNPRASLDIEVTDPQGTPLPGTHVQMIGTVNRYGTTGADGALKVTGLRTGPYRLRFEADGYTTLERELTLPVPGDQLDVTLTPAPPQAPPPQAARAEPPRPVGEARAVSVPSFAEANTIGRGQPQKLDVVGCTGYSTTRVLQIREPVETRQNADADETLYVVQGSVILRVGGNDRGLEAGGLAVLPRGTVSSLSRRGREVAVLVSVLSGPACPDAK